MGHRFDEGHPMVNKMRNDGLTVHIVGGEVGDDRRNVVAEARPEHAPPPESAYEPRLDKKEAWKNRKVMGISHFDAMLGKRDEADTRENPANLSKKPAEYEKERENEVDRDKEPPVRILLSRTRIRHLLNSHSVRPFQRFQVLGASVYLDWQGGNSGIMVVRSDGGIETRNAVMELLEEVNEDSWRRQRQQKRNYGSKGVHGGWSVRGIYGPIRKSSDQIQITIGREHFDKRSSCTSGTR